jgi:hypothetical protein
MTNTVTPDTGRRLAAAGFPQPAPAPGQWWGDDERIVFIVNKWTDKRHREYFAVLTTVNIDVPIIDFYFDARDFAGLIPLPTVGDILREMGEKYSLLCVGGKNWIVNREINTTFEDSEYDYVTESCPVENHEHPAEAAALAYLSIHEKK